jgi:hypothetical protein
MNNPILRMATNTTAVKTGFFAAGLTVAGIAIMQSLATVMIWVASLAG